MRETCDRLGIAVSVFVLNHTSHKAASKKVQEGDPGTNTRIQARMEQELQGRGETEASNKAIPSSIFRSIFPEAGCHMTATQCLTPPPFPLWWQCVCNDIWTTHYNSTSNLFHNEQKLDGCVREMNRRDTGGRNSLSSLCSIPNTPGVQAIPAKRR